MFGTGNRGRLAFAAAFLTLPAGCVGSLKDTYSHPGGHCALQNKQGDYITAYALHQEG
jgi:hypothetical protein